MQRRKLLETSLLSALPFVPLTAYTQQTVEETESLADILPPHMANLARLETGQKVEVRKFLGYWCPHCASLEPHFNKWSKTLDSTVKIRRTPVAFRPWQEELAILLLVIESFANKNHSALHLEVFSAIHQSRALSPSTTVSQLQSFAASILKEPEAQIKSRWDSFSVRTRLTNEKRLVTQFGVQGIPNVIIQGRFMTSPSRVQHAAAQRDQVLNVFFQTLDNLIKKAKS